MFQDLDNASIKKVFQDSDPKMTQALMGQNLPEDWGRSPPTIEEEGEAFPVFRINYHLFKRRQR